MFFDVFQSLCEKKGVSCKRAAEDIGLSNSITTKWKKTGATPSGETLGKIASYFNVTIDYLLDPKSSFGPNSKVDTQSADILNEVDLAFYGDYKELDEDDKETVRDMVRVMRERRLRKQEK